MRWRTIASSAAKGSSINRSLGPSASTYTKATRLRWPPLSARGKRWPNLASPSLPSHASASSRAGGRAYHWRQGASWIVLLVAGRQLRLRYVTQVNTRPPSFALFASKPGELPDSYRRYLVNALREDFDLPGTPIRMMLRKGKNPYDAR
jgi:hypothetical protein